MNQFINKIIIITAPSGAGKSTITKYLLEKMPELQFSVSATTRQPRGDEQNGKEYYFLSVEEFQKLIEEEAFIEWEMVYEGKYYGTLKSEIHRLWENNKCPLLDIDVKGAIHVEKLFPQSCLSIFIEPPTVEELKKRLESRGTDDAETIATRVNKASYEISFKHHFDKIIVNDHLEKACNEAEFVVNDFLHHR
ncbi:MAG: guanylate kinase [Bacteroidia bacterium]|nr:MAG: guanylate kinase [Bacteroidia bacterium]